MPLRRVLCYVFGTVAMPPFGQTVQLRRHPVSLPVKSRRCSILLLVQSSRVLFRCRCNRRAVFYCRRNCLAALFLFPLPLWRRPVLFPARCGAALLHGRCNRRADLLYGKRHVRRLRYSVLSPKVSFTASCRCASAGAPRHICVAAARCCCGCRPVLP